MANHIFYNPDGYIESVIEGDQTYMSIKNLEGDALDMVQDLQAKGKKRLGLVDLSKIGKYTPDSNRASMELLESINYEKVAMFGAGKILTEVVKTIILAMGKTENTKIFVKREEALAWLLSEEKKT